MGDQGLVIRDQGWGNQGSGIGVAPSCAAETLPEGEIKNQGLGKGDLGLGIGD